MGDIHLIDVLINWLPMLLLIGAWVFFLRRMNTGKGFQKDYIEEMRKQTAIFERIAAALEKQA